jgi:hypothetical protein
VFAYSTRAAAYNSKLDFDKAVADYSKAIELDPKGALHFVGRGYAYRGKHDADKAKADFKAALAIEPGNKIAVEALKFISAPPTPRVASVTKPMKVMIVRSASPDCGAACPEWISAEGYIGSETPALFKKVLGQLGGRKLPLFIDSGGGSVDESYEIGRMVRAKGLDVFVTKTELVPCAAADAACKARAKGAALGVARPHESKCASSCAFILASGARRFVGRSSRVGVHQITSTLTRFKVWTVREGQTVISERRVPQETVVTKTSDRTYSKAQDFFGGMGVNSTIMALMKAAPSQDMHWLTEAELRSTGIATDLINAEQYLAGVKTPVWTDADQQGWVETRRQLSLAAAAKASKDEAEAGSKKGAAAKAKAGPVGAR